MIGQLDMGEVWIPKYVIYAQPLNFALMINETERIQISLGVILVKLQHIINMFILLDTILNKNALLHIVIINIIREAEEDLTDDEGASVFDENNSSREKIYNF